jgi:TolB-like protein/class 3 adenylate cyclase
MVEDRVQRRLAAIFAADVVGYSRLMGVDEESTLRTLQSYREIIDRLIVRHDGRIFATGGDSVLAEFASPVEAVRCAMAIQDELAVRNTELVEDRRMHLRIGINIGDVMVEGDNLLGDGVNVAARLESIAEPGGICISGSTFEQVRNKLPIGFEDIGPQKVKNIAEPVPAYRLVADRGSVPAGVNAAALPGGARRWLMPAMAAAVLVIIAAGGLAVWRPWAPTVEPASVERMASALPDKPSIAVLPFTNISDDPGQEYFADGMSEDLITDLSKISGLLVIARNSTFAYKGKSVDLRQVAKELGVRYVLEGSVRKAGRQVRINAQLIDATTGGHLWADRYDGDLEDVFGLQDKVTAKIVTVLAVKLAAGEQERIDRKETENTEAYDTFLKGWEHYQRQRPESFIQAIALFEKATKLDSDYSRAYAALSATYWQIWKRTWFGEIGRGWESLHEPQFLAEEFLEKAMLDPTPLALQIAAAMFSQQGRHADAINEGERAIALDPNDADSYVALSGALSLEGQFKKAQELIERAMRLNPHYPPSYLYELGLARFGMEQFAEAAISLEKATALNPDDRWSQRLLLAAYGHLDRGEDAAKIFKAAEKNWRGFDPLSVRGVAFWYPFKQPADAERLAEGLRRANVPD